MLSRLASHIIHRAWLDAFRRKRADFQRAVAYGDYVVDRWEKAKLLGFGEGSSIYDSSIVIGDVRVGRNVWIGPFTLLDGSGGLEIGDGCNISAGCQIYSHDSIARCVTGGAAPLERERVTIGSGTYLGPNVVVAKGVKIGSGCVVGANSLVLADVPDGCMAVGSPSRNLGPHGYKSAR